MHPILFRIGGFEIALIGVIVALGILAFVVFSAMRGRREDALYGLLIALGILAAAAIAYLRGFHLDIAFYGAFIAVGILVAVFVAVRRGQQVGIAPEVILDLTFFGVLIGFIGSRLFFILTDLKGFVAHPLPYIFSRQGYVFFGGLIASLIFVVWYIRRQRAEPWQIGDVLAPAIPLGHAFGRIGCFFSGCCFGRVCPEGWAGWGIQIPKVVDPDNGEPIFSFAYLDHLNRHWIGEEATHSLPIFPVQLYEAGALLLIAAGLMWLWRRRSFRGQIFAAYLIAYGVARFALEFLRGDYHEAALYGLIPRGLMSQLTCLAAVAAGVTIWLLRRHTPPEIAAEPSPAAPRNAGEERSGAKRARRRSVRKSGSGAGA